MSPLPLRFLKRDASSASWIFQFYARVVVELELRYVQRRAVVWQLFFIGERDLVVQLAAIYRYIGRYIYLKDMFNSGFLILRI